MMHIKAVKNKTKHHHNVGGPLAELKCLPINRLFRSVPRETHFFSQVKAASCNPSH